MRQCSSLQQMYYDKDCEDAVELLGSTPHMKLNHRLATCAMAVGQSAGATISVAIDVAEPDEKQSKRIAVIVPSHGERCLGTDLYADPH